MFHAKTRRTQRIKAKTLASFAPWHEKIFFFFLLLHCFCSHAQKYSFKNYTVADGLGSSSVNHIFQDSKGYIWFATQGGGASRFNGTEFKNFTKADGLINNDVTYITEDKKGGIWIGTAQGASLFDGTSFRSYSGKQGLTDGVVYSIYADEENNVWFALQDGGAKIFNGTKFDSLTTQDGLPSNEVYSITQDSRGNYWFGLSNGIAKYSKGKITSYHDSALIKDKAFFSALVDDSNNVWFGSIGGGVLIIHPDNTMHQLELPSLLQSDFIGGLAQDKKGNVWLATDHGLLKYNGKEFQLFSEYEGLSASMAQAVMCDYEGNIWIGMLGGGVNLLSSEAFVHYTDKDGLTGRSVNCICPDISGKSYYMGTGDGLYVFNSTSEVPFHKVIGIKEIENTNISSLSIDEKEFLWLCAQEGVFVLELKNGSFKLSREYKQIAGERVISPHKIIHDSKGNCWIATYGSGMFFINPKTDKSYNTKNGFQSDNILTIHEDAQSNIWIGTQDAGIIKYDGNSFQPISLKDSLSDKSVWSVAEDSNGNIYWGTGESGLYGYNGKKITRYTSSDGLCSDYITALKWDKYENCLWAGSEKGLDKINFTTAHKIESVHGYQEQDGFNSAGINQDAIWIDNEGLLWLGTTDGLWLFNHNYDFQKSTPQKIQLTGIRLFYQKADWKKFTDSVDTRNNLPIGVKLPYNKNHLTFDIQALTTRDVLYTFKLEGQDEEWSSPAKNNQITYSNISPGQQYTFRAKAISSEGVSSNESVLFSFTVNPPWWSTLWFRVAIFLAVIGLLIAIIKTREKVLKDQNLKLEEVVKLRTLEIAHQKEIVENTLSEKEGLLHEKEILLKEIHHRVKNNLQTISSMLMLQSAALKDEGAKKAIAESQNRVRSIALVHQRLYQTEGLEKVELNAFVEDLTAQVKSLYHQHSKQVSINWNIPETHLLIDTAIPLGLILNELLTNSLKYAFNKSGNGVINIELNHLTDNDISTRNNLKTKNVRLIYRDSGPGFDPSLLTGEGSTLGLRLINLLSQQIGAALNYSNSSGSEFIFTFELHV